MRKSAPNSILMKIWIFAALMILAGSYASASISGIQLTSPSMNQSFTLDSVNSPAVMPITFNFNLSHNTSNNASDILNREFTSAIASENNITCDIAVSGAIQGNSSPYNNTFNNITSGFSSDLSVGEYMWSVVCQAFDSMANITVAHNSTTQNFSIKTLPLTLDAQATPTTGITPLTVRFSANAAGGIPQYYYLWNFGDGGVFSTYQNMSYTYQVNGTYNATVQMRDSLNQMVERSFIIQVQKQKNFTSSITMDKAEYIIGENSHISINAPINTSVQLRFFKDNVQVDSMDFVHTVANSDYIYLMYAPYPVSIAGDYVMKAYLTHDGVTNNHSVNFKLKNLETVLTLTANIVVDSTLVDTNRDISLRSSASGGIPPYSYEWDTNNDGTIDSTNVDTTARFGIGNFTVKLSVRDSNNTQAIKTIAINSKEPAYHVMITVADARTNNILQDANVTFAGILKNTGIGGGAEYALKSGNYTLKAEKTGYTTDEKSFELKDDLALTIRLNSTSLSPVTTNNATTTEDANDGTAKSTAAESGDAGVSASSGSDPSNNADASELLSWIQESLERFDSLDIKEREAVESMKLIESLQNKEKEIERIARDIADLKYLTGTAAQIADRERELTSRLRTIKGEIPKEIAVVDSAEFVKYPRSDDISVLLGELKKSNDSDSIETIMSIQSKVSVLSKIKKVKLTYYYLDPKTFFVVDKEITKKDSLENYTFAESIPKSLAISTKDITFQNTYTLLKEDPIVEIDTNDLERISYYFESGADIEEAEKIKSILMPKSNVVKKKSGFFSATGFSIKNLVPIKIADSTLFLEVTAIIVLLMAYLMYSYSDELKGLGFGSFGGIGALGGLFGKTAHNGKDTEYMRKLIGEAMDNIERWNLEKAYMSYEEIKLLYKSLSAADKGIVYEEIAKIASEINTKHALKLVDEAFDLLRAGEKEKAISRYNDVQEIYNSLPDSWKEMLHEKSMHLYSAISA